MERQVAGLGDLAVALNPALDQGDVCQEAAEVMGRLVNAASTRVVALEDSGQFRTRAQAGELCNWFGEQAVEPGQGITGWVALRRKALCLESGESELPDGNCTPELASGGCGVLCVPLTVRDRLLGLVELVARREGPRFGAPELEMVCAGAAQVALALDRARLYQEMQFQNITDRVTGMWNHGEFRQRLAEEIARSERYKAPVSLALLDVDNFQELNERHGHRKGDELLRQVATCVRASLRATDVGARYGGDEIAVILPETDREGALMAAEKVRATVAGRDYLVDATTGATVLLTVSIGLASVPSDAATPDALVAAVEEALSEAKRNGRNQVRPYRAS